MLNKVKQCHVFKFYLLKYKILIKNFIIIAVFIKIYFLFYSLNAFNAFNAVHAFLNPIIKQSLQYLRLPFKFTALFILQFSLNFNLKKMAKIQTRF